MKAYKLKNFTKGWFIGDFTPSLVHTHDFEVAVKVYKKGDKEKAHFHKVAQEYTIITEGTFEVNGNLYTTGDIIHFEPHDVSYFQCLENGSTTVIKIPSVANDKFEVEE